MSNQDIFEQASVLKLRFPFRGQATTEDLWDIALSDLDTMYMGLRRELEASQGESLLGAKTRENLVLGLKADILAHVVRVRLAQREAREQQAANAVRKQQILGIIQRKQDAKLEEMDTEELLRLVEELGG